MNKYMDEAKSIRAAIDGLAEGQPAEKLINNKAAFQFWKENDERFDKKKVPAAVRSRGFFLFFVEVIVIVIHIGGHDLTETNPAADLHILYLGMDQFLDLHGILNIL